MPETYETSHITLTVKGLRNDKGLIRVILFDSEEGFPGKHEKGIRALNVKAVKPETTLILKDVPHGQYAIAILHDENENGKMDTNLVGIPKEGYGVSNDAPAKMFGPPEYEQAAFILSSDVKKMSIRLVY